MMAILEYKPEMRPDIERMLIQVQQDPEVCSLVAPGYFDMFFNEYVPKGKAWVHIAQKIDGFSGYHPASSYTNRNTGKVYVKDEPFFHTLVVDEDSRQKGGGGCLVDICLEDAWANGLANMKIRTSTPAAIKLYMSKGFEVFDTEWLKFEGKYWLKRHLKVANPNIFK